MSLTLTQMANFVKARYPTADVWVQKTVISGPRLIHHRRGICPECCRYLGVELQDCRVLMPAAPLPCARCEFTGLDLAFPRLEDWAVIEPQLAP